MSSPIRVGVLDPVRVSGEALAFVLRAHPQTADVREVAEPGPEYDVVVVRVLGDPAPAVRDVLTGWPAARVLVAGIPDRADLVLRAIEAGAAGYVPQSASGADLVGAVEAVHNATFVCPPHVTRAIFDRLRERAGVSAPADPLSGRERQVVRLVERGLSNKEIARELGLALHTVKNHVHRILSKLGVRRRRDAVRAAGG